jgi:hypothetical protein
MLASGSIDGLINIFDVSKTCEDDALQQSLNTESSVVSFSNVLYLFIITCRAFSPVDTGGSFPGSNVAEV